MRFPKPTSNFKPINAGTHPAVLSGIVDVGVQPSNNPKFTPKHEILFIWQVPGELRDDGGPQQVTRSFAASWHKKANLRKMVEGWAGKAFPSDDAAAEFDVASLLGRGCLITVTHNERGDRTYANVTTVGQLIKGMEKPALVGKTTLYDPSKADAQDVYDTLPEWIQKKIGQQIAPADEEREAIQAESASSIEDDNGINF